MKRLIAVMSTLLLVSGMAFASVEVNKADQAALDGIRGIGPSLSNTILTERSKGGDFKDWADLEKRVKGISTKNSVKFSKAGLVVNGQSKEGAPVDPAPAAKPAASPSGKPVPAGK